MAYLKIPSPNKKSGNNPKYLVLHYTAGSFQGSIDTFMDSNTKVSSHYLISKKGEIVQMVEESDIAFHAGKSKYGTDSGLNNLSIGIEIENWGPLTKQSDGTFKNIYNYTHKGLVYTHTPYQGTPTYWDYYPFVQMGSLVSLCKDIFTRTGPLIIVTHQEIAIPFGRKTDPGPAFDLNRFKLEMS